MRYLPVLVLTICLWGCGGDQESPKIMTKIEKQRMIDSIVLVSDSIYAETNKRIAENNNILANAINRRAQALPDSLRSAAPPESSGSRISPGLVLVAELKDGESPPCDSIYFARLDSLNGLLRPQDCFYSTEAEVCKVRGHDLTHRVGWSDFPNPFYDETYFECKWCGAIIRRIINSPAPDTAYKEKSPPTK